MVKILLIIVLIVIIVLLVKNKVIIDVASFFHKGFKANRGRFGVYCFVGKQGSGKTFATVKFLLANQDKPIYSNITLTGIKYKHFSTLEEMLAIKENDCIIVFDEIFSALTKASKIDSDVLSFLSQQRKRKILFLTTAQEWLEIPITLRRYVRFQIDCRIFNLFPFSILITTFHNGDTIKWSNEENDYVSEIMSTKISKMNIKITEHYDTWEQIAVSRGRVALRATSRAVL